MSANFAQLLGLVMLQFQGPTLYLRMANDAASLITHFVKFPLVVGRDPLNCYCLHRGQKLILQLVVGERDG
jgi:hypothetical protein